MKRVYIFGTGSGAVRYLESVQDPLVVLGFVDSFKLGKFYNLPIYKLEQIVDKPFDHIVLANECVETYFACKDVGIADAQLKIPFYRLMFDVVANGLVQQWAMFSPSLHNCRPCLTRAMHYEAENCEDSTYAAECDYVRFRQLELLAEQIAQQNVYGSIAEVGVFQGHFAKHLNRLFPKRKLYLFDTFEGFSNLDKGLDEKSGYSNQFVFDKLKYFENTSIELVRSKMTYPEQCVFRQGYFPSTTKGLDEHFALVSLDADLYQPMFAGLEYFYPRLAVGGFLMVHEYNYPTFTGVKKAVKDFEAEHGVVTKIPIPDANGTLLITK